MAARLALGRPGPGNLAPPAQIWFFADISSASDLDQTQQLLSQRANCDDGAYHAKAHDSKGSRNSLDRLFWPLAASYHGGNKIFAMCEARKANTRDM
jgi:hypothetical protein